MNGQLSSFFGLHGVLLISLAFFCCMFGSIFLDAKPWPKILLTIVIILALGAFVLWSIAIYYNTIA